MAIAFSGASDELGSPFLATYERCAQEWSAFATEIGAITSGSFNSWHFDAQLAISTRSGTFNIRGLKRISTVGGGIPMDGSICEETRYSGSLGAAAPALFTIRPKSSITWLSKLMARPSFQSGIRDEMVVQTKDREGYQRAIAGHEQAFLALQFDLLEFTDRPAIVARSSVLLSTREDLLRAWFLLMELTRPK